MRTKISVTQEHIKNGQPNEPCNCPIALAISEKLNRESYASVDIPEFEIRQNGFSEKTKSFKTTKRLCDFISKFDDPAALINFPVPTYAWVGLTSNGGLLRVAAHAKRVVRQAGETAFNLPVISSDE